MSKISKYLCDKKGCSKERAGGNSLRIFSHSSMDASGNGYDHWQATADLCPEHLLYFAQRLIGVIEDKKIPNPLKSLFEEWDIKYELL